MGPKWRDAPRDRGAPGKRLSDPCERQEEDTHIAAVVGVLWWSRTETSHIKRCLNSLRRSRHDTFDLCRLMTKTGWLKVTFVDILSSEKFYANDGPGSVCVRARARVRGSGIATIFSSDFENIYFCFFFLFFLLFLILIHRFLHTSSSVFLNSVHSKIWIIRGIQIEERWN